MNDGRKEATVAFEDWILDNGGQLQVPLFFGTLVLLVIAERLLPRRLRLDRLRRWPTNWALTAINIVSLGFIPLSFIGAAVIAEQRMVGLFHQVAMPLPLLVLLTLLVRGFISFFTHFLNHKIPFLWRFHRVHHLDTELDVSSTVRFHPVEFFLSSAIGLPIVFAFGLSPWVLAVYELLDVAVTLFSHSNLRIPQWIDRRLRYLIVTPDLHRVHHSSWQPETDSNFGAVFPIWDLFFGTFRAEPRDGHEGMQLGLRDLREPDANRLPVLLLAPFRRQPAPEQVSHPAPDWAEVAFHPPVVLLLLIGLGVLLRGWRQLAFLSQPWPLVIGPLLVALAVALFVWAVATMRRGAATVPCKQPTEAIVVTGPYRWSRNPIYLAMLALLGGLGLWANSAWFLVLAVIFLLLLEPGVVRREERYLERKFQDRYRSYCQGVRRWL